MRHLLTLAVKEIQRTRTKLLLQWQAENGQKNVLFRGEKMFTIKKQYNNQNKKIMPKRPFRSILRIQKAITPHT
jgi:hypothetical protein